MLADATADVEARAVGEHHVQQHAGDRVRAERVDRAARIGRGHDAEVLDGEEVAEQRDDLRVVLDQQHGGHGVSLARGRRQRTRFPRMFIFGAHGASSPRGGLEGMKRFLTIIAATAVAAAVTIPALADSGSPSDEGTFATCLRAHGIPIPAGLEGGAVKQWIGAHPDTAGLEDAFKGCDARGRQGRPTRRRRNCARAWPARGSTPPTSLDELKPWVLQQSQTAAGKDALKACGFGGVEEKHVVEADGPCGADKPRAKTSRAQRPKAHTTPTT